MDTEVTRPRVLIADAKTARRDTICRLLEDVCDVEVASDARTAFEVACARPPDLVLADPVLPSPEGFVLLLALREHEATRSVPVILLTTRAGARPHAGALVAGVDDCLTERHLRRELLSRVQPRLELARLRRELVRRERQARVELDAANRAREEFLAILGHELRNPLGSITNAAWLLGSPNVPDDVVVRAREVLGRQSAHLAQVVDELLDVARLSFGSVPERATLLLDSAAGVPGPPAARPDGSPTRPRCVLLVEDNDDAREMMSAVLAGAGHRVVDAADGVIALERAHAEHPDVALVDVGMPRLDGYALARRLRNDPATADVPLIAVTGYGQPEDESRGREAGFIAHLVKPVDPGRLLEIVAGVQPVQPSKDPEPAL